MFKQNIGIMIAIAQLAATQQRFAVLQNEFRRFGMDIVAASVRHVQDRGYAGGLHPEHIAAAIALLFENFTTVFVGRNTLNLDISDEDAQEDGFADAAAVLPGLRDYYPDLSSDDYVVFVRFDVHEV